MDSQDSKNIGTEPDKAELVEVLFNSYYNPLCNFVYRRVGNITDAEDIVQEVFCTMWLHNNLNLADPSMVKWLFVVTKNKSIDFLRKKKLNNMLLSNFESESSDMEEFERDVIKERILESMNLLPEKCRKVFNMAKFEGMTYSEIAAKEEISVKTVEGHITKAFRIIKSVLGS